MEIEVYKGRKIRLEGSSFIASIEGFASGPKIIKRSSLPALKKAIDKEIGEAITTPITLMQARSYKATPHPVTVVGLKKVRESWRGTHRLLVQRQKFTRGVPNGEVEIAEEDLDHLYTLDQEIIDGMSNIDKEEEEFRTAMDKKRKAWTDKLEALRIKNAEAVERLLLEASRANSGEKA